MSKQEEIKQALAAASTEHEWDTDGTFIQWKDGHVLQGTYRQIAITNNANTPEVFNNPNHENDANLIAKAPEYIAYLLEENERLRKDLEEVHTYRKSMVRLMREVTDILSMSNPASQDVALERIYRWLEENKLMGQEGEGNQCK